ncbi:LacI family transcriptional regulator [Halobacillus litoralis]|uniref:LacI family DNA-binding transcriptional regulator n=1 Tax=Halobacillus litoralis TaxID=45668 RepID=UPI001CD2615D|nr:LacI family DNA-binding transcriptional regulator [Halobacillus litoralis]MCA0971241.1 LacI family transcriptional regulator [Halobacillus litoralis]
MVTIDDVAELAGLSKSTVSRVINHYPHVSKEKKQRVYEAMETLGYVPNSSARSLRNKKTKMIAVIVPRLMNPFFGQLVESMEVAANQQGYQLLICQTMYSKETELGHLELLKTKQVDGIILASLENEWEDIAEYLAYGPLIMCNEFDESAEIPIIKLDQIHGGYIATKHLLRLGHTKLAYCSGGYKSMVANHRKVGFEKALAERGLTFQESCGFYQAYTIENGMEVFKEIHKMKDPPTAVFTGSDEVAAGIITGAREYGVKVPEELSVIGFDNQVISRIMDPTISTVEQPIEQMAQKAVHVLLEKIHSQKALSKERYELPLELIIRESTVGGPLRAVE